MERLIGGRPWPSAGTSRGDPEVLGADPAEVDLLRRRKTLRLQLMVAPPLLVVVIVAAIVQGASTTVVAASITLVPLLLALLVNLRGLHDASYVLLAMTLVVALLARPLATDDAGVTVMYCGPIALLLSFSAPPRLRTAIGGVVLLTAFIVFLGTTDADTPAVEWNRSLVSGFLVSAVTIVIGIFGLATTQRALGLLYRARTESVQTAAEYEAARAELEETVSARTASLEAALAESRRLVEQLSQESLTDGLTGVRNRRFLDEELPRMVASCVRSGSQVSVMMIDLDNFKAVNDRFSHGLGDRVLRDVAGLLSAALDMPGVLCRYGGDEFVALLPGKSLRDAQHIGDRMRRVLAASPISGLQDMPIGLTLGAATFDGSARSLSSDLRSRRAVAEAVSELLDVAEQRLRESKAERRGP